MGLGQERVREEILLEKTRSRLVGFHEEFFVPIEVTTGWPCGSDKLKEVERVAECVVRDLGVHVEGVQQLLEAVAF